MMFECVFVILKFIFFKIFSRFMMSFMSAYRLILFVFLFLFMMRLIEIVLMCLVSGMFVFMSVMDFEYMVVIEDESLFSRVSVFTRIVNGKAFLFGKIFKSDFFVSVLCLILCCESFFVLVLFIENEGNE